MAAAKPPEVTEFYISMSDCQRDWLWLWHVCKQCELLPARAPHNDDCQARIGCDWYIVHLIYSLKYWTYFCNAMINSCLVHHGTDNKWPWNKSSALAFKNSHKGYWMNENGT
jgi:hypothetical protein